MTSDKDLKRVVRARMAKTGESYATARARILSKPPRSRIASPATTGAAPRLSSVPQPISGTAYATLAGMADARIAAQTDRTWEEWVRVLDAEKAGAMAHRDIARLVSEKYGVKPWWTQAVTVGYERIKGLRARGQRRDGTYEASKSRTFDVPVTRLFDAWATSATRRRWLAAKAVKVRTATRPRSMRLEWSDGTVIALWFTAKGKKSTVSVQHTRLRDRATAERQKEYWSEQLASLAELLGRV